MSQVTDDALLDAALDQFLDLGVKRTTAEDICRAAGVNRATLYRRIGDKDAVVKATLERELARFIGDVLTYAATFTDLEERAAHAFARTVVGIRRHPLFRRLIAGRDYDALASMTTGAAPGIELGTSFVASQIRQWGVEFGVRWRGDVDAAAVVTRLMHSLALIPEGPPHLHSEQDLMEFAQTFVIPLLVPVEQRRAQ